MATIVLVGAGTGEAGASGRRPPTCGRTRSASSTATGSAPSSGRPSRRWCAPTRAIGTSSGSRTTATTSATTSRRCGSSRRSPGSGSDVTWTERLPRRAQRAADDGPPGQRRHPHVRALARAVVLDEPVRSASPTRSCPARRARTRTRRTGTSPAAATRSWSCSSTRPASRRSTTRSAATTRTGARRSPSTASSATPAGPCNNNCIEPVNFAFIQRNGVPAGPPSPQLVRPATFTPNGQTLMMNPGDRLVIHMFDAKVAGRARVRGARARPHDRPERRDDRLGRERLHEHEHRRLQRHAVQLPARVLDREGRQRRAVGLRPVQHQHRVRDRPLRAVHDA